MSEYYYLGSWDSNGYPNYVEETESIDPDLLRRIRNAVPEFQPVPEYHPEYLSSTIEKNIIIQTDKSVI